MKLPKYIECIEVEVPKNWDDPDDIKDYYEYYIKGTKMKIGCKFNCEGCKSGSREERFVSLVGEIYDAFDDFSNKINISSFDGTFHHFNCLCYFMFENLFDTNSFFQNCKKRPSIAIS